jgi:hypothetical protein
MRPSSHEVQLAGGRLVLPLSMAALRILSRIPANPLDVKAGSVDPSKVLRGEQDLTTETILDTLAALHGNRAEDVFAMDTQRNLVDALFRYMLALMQAMGPEKQEAAPPKD